MEFAVNYSKVLAGLVREGQVKVDRFKCPAWPDLLADVLKLGPAYVHFPLTVGGGQGCPMDEEKHQPANVESIAGLMAMTGTPLVNTHFVPSVKDYPDIDPGSRSPRDIDRVVGNTLRDLEPLIYHFGADNVTLENVINDFGYLTLAVLPEVITRVLDESGVGFLFDLSHARLAARNLGLDERAYCAAMPVDRIREVHFTGLRIVEGELLGRLQAAGNSNGLLGVMAGKCMDHLPMTEADWPELEWAVGEMKQGRWREPWVIGYEVGGVGGFWEQVTDRETYLAEVPRLEKLIRGS